LFIIGFLFDKLAVNKEQKKNELQPEVEKLTHKKDMFDKAYKGLQKSEKDADQVAVWMRQRFYWGDFMSEMRRALIRSEDGIKKKLSAQKPGIEAGIWIEQMVSASNIGGAAAGGPIPGGPPPVMPGMPGMPRNFPGEGVPVQPAPQVDAGGQPATANTNIVTLVCRAVDLSKISGDASANSETAFAVENEIKNSPMVDPRSTSLVGNIVPDEATGTFTFTVNVAPADPPTFTPGNPTN
jgi:hypothetical protein